MRMTYDEFEAQYVEPTYRDFLEWLFRVPTWAGAKHWHSVLSKDYPMTAKEYEKHIEMVGIGDREKDEKAADRMNRLRVRTVFGWYIANWFKFLKNLVTTSFKEFKEIHHENAYNSWSYNYDDYEGY